MCFDYGRSFSLGMYIGKEEDLDTSDRIAMDVLNSIAQTVSADIKQQMYDNIQWIKGAKKNKLVVPSTHIIC